MMRGKKILIVDDDFDFSKTIKTVLEMKGFEVLLADSKTRAFAEIEKQLPDLIIMDVMMEKMSDGFDMTRKLKSEEKYAHIPILMLTAIGEITGFKFSPDLGDTSWLPCDDFAEKSIKTEALIAKVEKLLSA